MKKFEVGKRYAENETVEFEVLSRTGKTVKLATIQHPGRFNEKVTDVKTRKISVWNGEEVIFAGCYELHA